MSHSVNREGMVGNSHISIGRFTYGFENLSVRQWNEGASLQIGSFCSISSNVTIFLGGHHRTDWITTFPFGHIFEDELGGKNIEGHPATKGDVLIGNDVWIASGVTILSGVTVGDGAVLSANATVIKDVKPYEIVGGNPAKSLKMRFDDELVNLLLTLKWWDFPLDKIKLITNQLSSQPTKNDLIKLIKSVNYF